MINKTKEPFSSKFINENVIKSIEDEYEQEKFWYYSYSILYIGAPCCFLPFFVGYNMENLVCIIFNILDFICYFFFIYFIIQFLLLIHKYKVYKKIIYGYIYVLINVILTVTFSLVAYFTTKVTVYSFYSMKADINLGLFILIYMPLMIIFICFAYYSQLKCFTKYSRAYKRKHKDDINK